MSITKRISGDYNIVNKGPGLVTGNVTITTNILYVDGNLTIGGNSTSVTRTELNIIDPVLTLNKGETGSGVTLITSGFSVDRGTLPTVGIQWNELNSQWALTSDGTIYEYIASSITGTAIANVYADPSPAISSNLDLRNRTIFDSTLGTSANIKIGTPDSGNSGVYIGNGNLLNQELINKTKLLIYQNLL